MMIVDDLCRQSSSFLSFLMIGVYACGWTGALHGLEWHSGWCGCVGVLLQRLGAAVAVRHVADLMR